MCWFTTPRRPRSGCGSSTCSATTRRTAGRCRPRSCPGYTSMCRKPSTRRSKQSRRTRANSDAAASGSTSTARLRARRAGSSAWITPKAWTSSACCSTDKENRVPSEQPRNEPKSGNVFSVEHRVPAAERVRMNAHRGGILWFTGLSGAGKSTLAVELERLLVRSGCQAYLLDGDNLRQGLNADLGFSPADRAENIRRVGEVAALFADAGMIVISAFISPYRADRE